MEIKKYLPAAALLLTAAKPPESADILSYWPLVVAGLLVITIGAILLRTAGRSSPNEVSRGVPTRTTVIRGTEKYK